MGNTFFVDNIEYKIVRNPHTNGPMVARVDGAIIDNRKKICRRFLRQHGWNDSMFGNKNNEDINLKNKREKKNYTAVEEIIEAEKTENSVFVIIFLFSFRGGNFK